MSDGRKYILELDARTIRFEISEFDPRSLPTWFGYEECSAAELYGKLRRDREFIYGINFSVGDRGTHVIWNDLESGCHHYLISRPEWAQFLYLARLSKEEITFNWKEEGF